MRFTVTCACGKKLAARDEQIGKRAKCPQCGQILRIAAPATQPASPTKAAETFTGAEHHTPAIPPEDATAPLYDGQRLEHWLDLLASADANDRRKAAEVLGGVGPEAAVELPTLVAYSTRPHILVRHWATVCLGQIGPAALGALEPLLARLNDEQPLVREKAAQAIGQIVPGAAAFAPRLLRELNRKDADHTQAIEVFRRDLKTAGISRLRFWACKCGRVYIKLDLEQRLRRIIEAPHELNWDATRTCGQCGAQYHDREIYAGKHDVPETYWSKLRAKFGKQLAVSDDLFDETKQEAGYRINEDATTTESSALPGSSPFSLNMETVFSSDMNDGYALAETPAPAPLYERHIARTSGPAEPELVPGATVPETGKYKCKTCAKRRLSNPAEANALVRASVILSFRSGKTFSECPNCGDLTEWEFIR